MTRSKQTKILAVLEDNQYTCTMLHTTDFDHTVYIMYV